MGSNRISEPSDLDRLTALPSLLEVTLAGNPISRKNNYRSLVTSRCPRLQVLDQQVRQEAEPPSGPAGAGSATAAAGCRCREGGGCGCWC